MQIKTQGRHQLSRDPGGGRALLSAVLLRLKDHPSLGAAAGAHSHLTAACAPLPVHPPTDGHALGPPASHPRLDAQALK